LEADLGKPVWESHAGETSFLAAEIRHAISRLPSWMRPRRVGNALLTQPGTARIESEPLGVVLNLAAWNYPLHIALAPLVGALAAGNCAVVKPSELAPATSAAIARWLPTYTDPAAVAVVEGGVEAATRLLEQPFDHIFFTGGPGVGRIVMKAAAERLCPVTLELGGKSPCIVDRSADLRTAARRIVWAKFMNAGQTCVAPDYVLVHEEVQEELLGRMQANIRRFYGEDPRESSDYGRIINQRHHRRLVGLLGSGEVVAGGSADEEERYIAPTILRDVDPESPAMQEEIFGPILPVLPVSSIEDAISFVSARPKALALYLFTRDSQVERTVLDRTSSGGVYINDAAVHLGVPNLPFGGVGPSGTGAYHGKASFDAFSHQRSVLSRATWIDPALRYPPFTESKLRWLRRLL
ncbi:MAG: aldehyde dehydrogenase family protein, partial [Myxococcota bacterium]|nr:aldehyde dehydrogenase family protein [Myxococcota bacterium]